ncbi:DNA primase [Aerophototrophica crusticola]|uniref:DNA primase n=1 Tax=Aerophototrophica crusticola TaxID=1709002 RepID=UPI00384D22BA
MRTRLPLSDVVMKRIRLIRAGREFKAPCPFHNEKSPSFYVNDQKGFFHCFGCGAHGDQIGFVMRHDNLSFMEAVEQLAAEAGLPVPKASPQERQRYERQKSLYDLVERAAKYYEQQLFTQAGQKALDYLRRRGLDEEAIARFRLGFAPQDGSGLHGMLTQAGYAEADMIEAGLFKRPDAGRGARAFFWGRVMFPVTDRRGRVVAFGGRIMEGEGPKYINSADNPLFHKGHLLYGMSRARQAAADGHTLIVTEGYMDVISCVLAGFEGAVAPLGTALTETQILELWKLAPEGRRTPILCFDGDNAGRRAAQRAVERLLPLLVPDHSACVAFLPEKEDPDSLIRTGGKAALQAVLERAKPLSEVLWEMESVGRDLFQPDARAGLEAALFERCAQIKDQRVRRAYEQDMRDRLFKLSRQHRAKGGPPRAGGGQRRPAPGEVPVSRLFDRAMVTGRIQVDFSAQARTLLGGMLRNPRYFDQFGERLAAITLDNAALEELRQEIVNQLTSQPDMDGESLVRILCELGLEETVNDVLRYLELRGLAWFSGANPDVEKAARDLLDIARKVEDRDLRRELAEAEENLRRDFSEENLSRLDQLRREYLAARGLSLDGEG